MRLEMLAKDENSGRSGCPSVYLDQDGWAVIQGPEVDPTARLKVAILPAGDTRVRISPQVLAAAVEALQQRRSDGQSAGGLVQSSVFLDSDGYAVVQGPEVESETRSNLVNLLSGETGVRISTDALTSAVAALQGP